MTSTALATVDKSNAASVITYLSQARDWLATCVEITGPQEIANVKAQIATAAEATKQLHLSKEIQLDAQEMVRRAEYALGKAIRKGQAEGTVAKRGDIGGTGDHHRGDDLPRPTEVSGEPNQTTLSHFYELAAAGDENFDAALGEAKTEGNLSRANVVRKVRGRQGDGRMTRTQKADLLAELAAQGYSSRQMCKQLGFSRDDSVRELAREYDIEIPADKAITRTRRINSTQLVVNTATALEGLVSGVELIDYDALDLAEVRQWATSLTDSMRVLNRFAKQIKEMTQ